MLFNILLLSISIAVLLLGTYAIRGLVKEDKFRVGGVLIAITGAYAGVAILAFLASLANR
jgi:hypothetical protein